MGTYIVPSQHSFVYLSSSLSLYLVPQCLFPSISVSSLAFNPLPISPSLFICFPLSKKKHSSSPRWRVSSIHTSVFHLVLHCSRENGDTKCQYLDSSSGEYQGSSIASLYELASEAVMSRPETSWGQNRARWFPPYSVMTDREIVPTIFDVCYMATGLGKTAKMASCPHSACLINISP